MNREELSQLAERENNNLFILKRNRVYMSQWERSLSFFLEGYS